MNKKPGFTLVEILIALIIVGIASVILVPKLLNTTGDSVKNARIRESVSVIKQMLVNAQRDESAIGESWLLYMSTQLNQQFAAVSGFTVPAGHGCFGSTPAGYSDGKMLLKDGTIIRILTNGVVGTQGGEIEICIDPVGDSYENPIVTMVKGKAASAGYTARVDLSAPTLRLNLSPTAAEVASLGVTTGTRVAVGSLDLF